MSKYVFVSAKTDARAVSDLCRVLGVSRSGYYHWWAAEPPLTPAEQTAA